MNKLYLSIILLVPGIALSSIVQGQEYALQAYAACTKRGLEPASPNWQQCFQEEKSRAQAYAQANPSTTLAQKGQSQNPPISSLGDVYVGDITVTNQMREPSSPSQEGNVKKGINELQVIWDD